MLSLSNIKEQFNIREGDNLFIRLGGGDSFGVTPYTGF